MLYNLRKMLGVPKMRKNLILVKSTEIKNKCTRNGKSTIIEKNKITKNVKNIESVKKYQKKKK